MPRAQTNNIELEYETFGNPADPAILLIMGLGGQLILWPEDFCRLLAQAGYFVIRYDNRDIGLSSKMQDAGRTRLMRAGLRAALGLKVQAPYTLDDMARDAVGLLDTLKIERAHVVGVSMGGMIAQLLAAHYPRRVDRLVLWMTTSGNPRLPGPSLKLRLRLVKRPKHTDRESMIRHSMETWRLIGSPKFPPDPATLRDKVERSFDRAFYPPGLARQTLAIIASGNRVLLLRRITAPTLILHGADDPLVPVHGAHDLARHIPGARMEVIPGMGHDLPTTLLPRLGGMILDHLQRSEPRAAA